MVTATTVNNSSYNYIGKGTTAFSGVLTAGEIRRKLSLDYSISQIQEVLFFLEDAGRTVSDCGYNRYGQFKCYFYLDENVAQELITELKHRGYKPNQRVRYPVPTYIKFYSIYQYDRQKFRELLNRWLVTKEGRTRTYSILMKRQQEFLEQCWVLDEENNKKRIGDEPHIFRYKTLHRILECIANCLIKDYGINTEDTVKYLYNRTNLAIYQSQEGLKPQAELLDTILYDIKSRIKIHLQILKGLKQGAEIEDAVNYARLKHCPIF